MLRKLLTTNWKVKRPTKETRIVYDKTDASPESQRYYSTKHILEYREDSFTGEVEVTVDVDALVRDMVYKATRNSSGKATAYGGLIKAKVKSSQVTATRRWDSPIPANYHELKEEKEKEENIKYHG